MLAGLYRKQLDRLQRVINAAARLVCSARKYEHIMPLLCDLHWLPVLCERIEFKLAVLVFHCLHGTAVPYLANDLCRVADIDARRRLRSASTSALITPSLRRSMIGDRAFFVAAQHVWKFTIQRHCITDTRHLQAPAEDTSFRCFPYLTHLVLNLRCTSFFCNVD